MRDVSWTLVGRDPADRDRLRAGLLEEAKAAVPAIFFDRPVTPLPLTAGKDGCRLCGRYRQLTKEHIPPGSAFNKGAVKTHNFDEWLDRENLEDLPGGTITQGGIWGYTLCASCNNNTGAWYVPEYQRWAVAAVNALADARANVKDLDAHLGPLRGKLHLGGDQLPRPGAFVRQVLAMMCSLSTGLDLAGNWWAIRRIVLEKSQESLPQGMSLGLTIFLGPGSRITPPSLVIDLAQQQWRWVTEVAHPPLATTLVLASSDEVEHVFDLSQFTLMPWDQRAEVKSDIETGFGHTPYPSDFRTRADIEAQASGHVSTTKSDGPARSKRDTV